MEVPHTLDMILTIVVLSFWFLFPIGIFLSVSHVDKNTDQLIQLDHLRHESEPGTTVVSVKERKQRVQRPRDFRPRPLPH